MLNPVYVCRFVTGGMSVLRGRDRALGSLSSSRNHRISFTLLRKLSSQALATPSAVSELEDDEEDDLVMVQALGKRGHNSVQLKNAHAKPHKRAS